MKKILLSSVALLGLTAGAFAADLPSRRVAPAPYVAVPVFTWTGFYVGVNAGYGFTDNNNNNAYYGTTAYGNDSSRDGFVGGGQIGYNYQIGNFVVGIEADAQYADLGGRNNNSYYGATGVGYGSSNQGIDWFGTVRGRLGYAFDRVLVYGTGGFAYGAGDNNNSYYGAGYAYGNRNSDTRTGWVAGGGVEYAFTPNITGRIEGLYVSLDRNNNDGYNGVVAPVYYGNRHNEDSFAVVRAGLNYKFNSF
jgi:outer membrane immunogenic protein